MPKTRTKFVCQQCESQYPTSYGRCPNCGSWNSMVETVEAMASPPTAPTTRPRTAPRALAAVDIATWGRLSTGGAELDRVLGGGLVPGSLVLLGGDPGIGKSTLLGQVCMAMAANAQVLYVTGEESSEQVKLRTDRLGAIPAGLFVMPEVDLGTIMTTIETMMPALAVIDSIQTVVLDDLSSSAGSVSQVRECAARLMHLAKRTHVPIVIVGHVTKEGTIAGPRVLEHIVDTVLYLEGERFHAYRLLRAVKNRFGSTNEVGVFEMGEDGLREVANPSAAFLSERGEAAPGSAVTVNVVGGLKIGEPAADLAVALAAVSAFSDVAIPSDVAAFGEVGLAGELRSVSAARTRLGEAAKLGFSRVLLPASNARALRKDAPVELLGAATLAEALRHALPR